MEYLIVKSLTHKEIDRKEIKYNTRLTSSLRKLLQTSFKKQLRKPDIFEKF